MHEIRPAVRQEQPPDQRRELGGAAWWGLAAALGLLGAGAAHWVHRRGLILSVDAWAYWEGSVSLLAGRGYRFLGGEPIIWWPPLFSLYLAAVSGFLGASGASLILALDFLAGAAAVAWFRLSYLGAGSPSLAAGLAAVSLVGFFAANDRALLSEALLLPLVGLAATSFVHAGLVGSLSLQRGAGLALLVTLGLLTRHAFVAFIPGLLVLTLAGRPQGAPRFRRGVEVAAAAAAGVIPSVLVRWSLGQMNSHPLEHWRGDVFVAELGNSVAGLARYLGPGAVGALVASGAVVVPTVAALGSFRSANPENPGLQARLALGLLCFAILGVVGQAGLLALVRSSVTESLLDRYLWFGVPALLAALALAATGARSRSVRWVAMALLVVSVGVQGRRLMYWGGQAGNASHQGLLLPNWVLDVDRPCGPALERPPFVVVTPPEYPWLQRCRGSDSSAQASTGPVVD